MEEMGKRHLVEEDGWEMVEVTLLEVVENRKLEEGEWRMVGVARLKVVEKLAAVPLEEAVVAAERRKVEVHWMEEVMVKLGRGWKVSGGWSRRRAELGVEKLEEEKEKMMLVVVNEQ